MDDAGLSWHWDILLSGFRPLILWDSDHLFSGIRNTYSLGPETFPGKQDILSSGNNFIIWELDYTYPLGIGPLIPWETFSDITLFQSMNITENAIEII